jgi:hypothetical protein
MAPCGAGAGTTSADSASAIRSTATCLLSSAGVNNLEFCVIAASVGQVAFSPLDPKRYVDDRPRRAGPASAMRPPCGKIWPYTVVVSWCGAAPLGSGPGEATTVDPKDDRVALLACLLCYAASAGATSRRCPIPLRSTKPFSAVTRSAITVPAQR